MDSYHRIKIINRICDPNNYTIVRNCYLWNKSIGSNGYGQTFLFGKLYLVHRLSYIIFNNNNLDFEGIIKHKTICKNKNCFNPDHLYIADKNLKEK